MLSRLCVGPVLVKPLKEGMNRAVQSKRPATTLRYGNIKATIWRNVSVKGPFFATTFSRPFKDQAGAWRNGTSFGLNDLEALMNVVCEAKEWMTVHTLKR